MFEIENFLIVVAVALALITFTFYVITDDWGLAEALGTWSSSSARAASTPAPLGSAGAWGDVRGTQDVRREDDGLDSCPAHPNIDGYQYRTSSIGTKMS